MVNEIIKNILSQIPHFYFLPNRGNLGDVVIATSEYQFFNENNYNYTVLDTQNVPQEDITLVYGGGGLWTKYYDFSDVTDIFKLKNIKKIIILPSSFNECDNLFDVVDERFTIFCREEKSYNYCLSKDLKAEFILSNDMALGLNIDFYKNSNKKYVKNIDSNLVKDIYNNLFLPYKNIFKFIPNIFKNITYKNNKAIGYFLRHDIESKTDWSNFDIKLNEDLSQILGSYCIDNSFSKILTKVFLSMIDTVDVVVTDRLHVGICGYLLNKEVILIDNSYGKLSSVYNYSLKDSKNVHLVSPEQIEETINNIINSTCITRKDNINAPSKFYSFLSEYLLNRTNNNRFENIMWQIFPKNKIQKFIEIHIPVTTCNLRCHYCYITQQRLFEKELPIFTHTPVEIANALHPDRLGGVCMLNMCGGGETLLPPEMLSIVEECLKTGNYVTIVTNGTLSNRFKELASLDIKLRERLFIKFSFQYLELKRLNLLEKFIENVKLIKEAKVSFSVEITPNDELVPYINEIKEISLKNFGALPHITIARIDTNPKIPILTKYSKDEYKKIWSTFDSKMFEYKLPLYEEKRTEFCFAGDWSFCTNVNDGIISQCYKGNCIGNIYNNIDKPLKFKPIGCNCKEPHCYNAHSFLLFGDIPNFSELTYADIRNRICNDGSEWLQPKMKEFMSSKLEESNFNPLKIEKYGY